MGRIKKLEERVDELEKWVTNLSAVQNQLLKELGYAIKWKHPNDVLIYIEKIKDTDSK
jgi:hypothetical protein